MNKILIGLIFSGCLIATGCQSKSTEAPEQAEKPAAPEEITLANISSVSFKEVDINEDGKFTYDEFDKITKNNGSAEGNTVYAEFDADGNGIISEEEFTGK